MYVVGLDEVQENNPIDNIKSIFFTIFILEVMFLIHDNCKYFILICQILVYNITLDIIKQDII